MFLLSALKFISRCLAINQRVFLVIIGFLFANFLVSPPIIEKIPEVIETPAPTVIPYIPTALPTVDPTPIPIPPTIMPTPLAIIRTYSKVSSRITSIWSKEWKESIPKSVKLISTFLPSLKSQGIGKIGGYWKISGSPATFSIQLDSPMNIDMISIGPETENNCAPKSLIVMNRNIEVLNATISTRIENKFELAESLYSDGLSLVIHSIGGDSVCLMNYTLYTKNIIVNE